MKLFYKFSHIHGMTMQHFKYHSSGIFSLIFFHSPRRHTQKWWRSFIIDFTMKTLYCLRAVRWFMTSAKWTILKMCCKSSHSVETLTSLRADKFVISTSSSYLTLNYLKKIHSCQPQTFQLYTYLVQFPACLCT